MKFFHLNRTPLKIFLDQYFFITSCQTLKVVVYIRPSQENPLDPTYSEGSYSDLFLLMPYYELSTLVTTHTIKVLLIWSVVGPCSRNIYRILLVYRTPGILLPYCKDGPACIFSQLNNTRIRIPCHETGCKFME